MPDMTWQGRITVGMSMVKFFLLVFNFLLRKKKKNTKKRDFGKCLGLPQRSYGPAWGFDKAPVTKI